MEDMVGRSYTARKTRALPGGMGADFQRCHESSINDPYPLPYRPGMIAKY
jgi:hypothetical protein